MKLKRIPCAITMEIQLTIDQQYEKPNLEQKEILPRFRSRESERAILDWLGNGKTTKSRSGLRTNVAQWLQCSFDFSSLLVGTELNVVAQGKALSLPLLLTTCHSKQIIS